MISYYCFQTIGNHLHQLYSSTESCVLSIKITEKHCRLYTWCWKLRVQRYAAYSKPDSLLTADMPFLQQFGKLVRSMMNAVGHRMQKTHITMPLSQYQTTKNCSQPVPIRSMPCPLLRSSFCMLTRSIPPSMSRVHRSSTVPSPHPPRVP
jgi:hypothetical protein